MQISSKDTRSSHLPVPLSVVTPLQTASSFLFIDGIEPFLAVSSPYGTLQNAVLRFLI